MPRGVMVAPEILDLFVKVRVLARQPRKTLRPLTWPMAISLPLEILTDNSVVGSAEAVFPLHP
jgi:hypothetical protein